MFAMFVAGLLSPLLSNGGRNRAWATPSPFKVDKKTARYQNHPEDGKMCMNCRNFIPPKGMGSMMEEMKQGMGSMDGPMGMGKMMAGGCTIVAGAISPMGYCRFYERKS
ncbi:MAG: hypothetical protein VST70_02515 [Nitrospirota bacterium]|nr:hypothetical protein [Nitrospirota bacterium]